MKFVVILLGFYCFHQAFGATHTLQYFYTATSGISNFPEFVDVGVVDGVPISRYDSNTQRKVPLQKWMAENFDQQYWDMYTDTLKGTEQVFKGNIETAKKRFNQTGGVHTLQLMYGCELNDDDTTKGYFQFGFDGEDFLSLDKRTLTWTAARPQAVPSKNKLDSTGAEARAQSNYLENTCIEWLKKYVMYGKETLGRKATPEVSISQQDATVVCHATGFYPDGVMITWKKDGVEMQDDVDVGETLPNNDGSFQKRAVLTVSLQERKNGQYTCEVAHKSGAPIVKTLTLEDDNTIGIIIGCVVAALVVTGVIVGVVMMRKKGYKKAEQSDSDSDTSNPIARNGAERVNC